MGVFSTLSLEQVIDREPTADCCEIQNNADCVSEPVSVCTDTPTVSVTDNNEPSAEQTESEKRQAHEETEAKRKAEWEAKKKEREEAEQIEWEKAVDMEEDALISASVKRLSDATERLTRRNMKICVTEYVQTKCYEDIDFARLVMHPRKNMINCFHFINRKAREYLEKEMQDNDEKPENGGFGGDVPDELCYQWAEEYFRDMNAKEDKTEEDKEFVSKPYRSTAAVSKKKATKKTEKKEKPATSQKSAKQESLTATQLSLFGGAA